MYDTPQDSKLHGKCNQQKIGVSEENEKGQGREKRYDGESRL